MIRKKISHIFYSWRNSQSDEKEKETFAAADLSTAKSTKGRSIQIKTLNGHILAVRDKVRNKYRVLQQAEALITAETTKQEYRGIQSNPS